ncbi:MAG: hypothetical protein II304_09740 [Bacteroidales bacterium]|nr:hypothetical protein [Bacteroidales bacterium]
MNSNVNDIEYSPLLLQFIGVVENSRFYATKQENALVELYWEIGKLLSEHPEYFNELEYDLLKICLDIKTKYPQLTLSIKNLQNAKKFYLRYYKCSKKIQKTVISLYWNYNLVLLNYNAPTNKITFYAKQIHCNNWSCEKLKSALQNSTNSQTKENVKKKKYTLFSKELDKAIKESSKRRTIGVEKAKRGKKKQKNKTKSEPHSVWMVFNSNGCRRY